jgi:hypothetical protein
MALAAELRFASELGAILGCLLHHNRRPAGPEPDLWMWSSDRGKPGRTGWLRKVFVVPIGLLEDFKQSDR